MSDWNTFERNAVKYTQYDLDKLCWVDTFNLPDELMPTKKERKKLWDMHPSERGKIKL